MPERPGQKLLRLDDYTVCAVAGLNQNAVVVAPTLNSDILGIIDTYNRQARERVSMGTTLQNIEGILCQRMLYFQYALLLLTSSNFFLSLRRRPICITMFANCS
jgi:hypothetical protein